jgi:hypothetical protein
VGNFIFFGNYYMITFFTDSLDQILLLSMASLLFHGLVGCAKAIEGGD